jgi:hypothetical protein
MKRAPLYSTSVVLLAWANLAMGATLHVDLGGGGEYTSIQAAIDAANPGDEIEVAPGTYYEAINFHGEAVRLYSSGGAAVTTIRGPGADPLVDPLIQCVTGEGPSTILDGFSITYGRAGLGGGMYNLGSSPAVVNCVFLGNFGSVHGGGMYNRNSNPSVSNCTFDWNHAGEAGGGIYNSASNPTLTNCTFSRNGADVAGGGMCNNASRPTVTNCAFSWNGAETDSHGLGGGMSNVASSPIVTSCTFSHNQARNGGAMSNDQASGPTVVSCAFADNWAAGGSGVFNRESNSIITDCSFTGNGGGVAAGGGIYNIFSDLTIVGCRFSYNGACLGGAICNCANDESMSIINCIFTWNRASGAGSALCSTNWGSVTMLNCVLCFNQGEATIAGHQTVTNCVFWSNSGGVGDVGVGGITYSNVEGGWPGEGNVDADPLFADPAGGDFHLQPGSPCIDAGDSSAVPPDVTTDLDGNPRIQGPGVDMGVYETTGSPKDVLDRAMDIIGGLDPGSLTNPNTGETLVNKLEAAIALIEAGSCQEALMKLQHDILPKTDGCALRGQPDKDDWITTCEAQQKVYPLVLQAIQRLEELI